jgi:hypothetical protein
MLVNGRIIKDGERVNSSGQMVLYMKDFGVVILQMERED